MNIDERVIVRHLFQNLIFKSDGQAFENLFTQLMSYYEPEFQQIKPWGNIGDRKNDGYVDSKGIFYQVYAPEDIRNSYTDAIFKLKNDFNGLKKHWDSIKEFYFVVNDKYKGVNADCELTLKEIKESNSLIKAGFKTSKDLENMLFELTDDQIFMITGKIPDPSSIKNIDFTVLKEVINYIMNLSLPKGQEGNITLPDWDKKIEFNGLSNSVKKLMNTASMFLIPLEEYLKNNGKFLSDTLRDKINELYCKEKSNYQGDSLFWQLVDKASPNNKQYYQISVITIISKYFESCDVFEEPVKNDNAD